MVEPGLYRPSWWRVILWASEGELGLYGPQKGKAAVLSLRVTRAVELSLEAFAFRLKAY